MMKLIIKQIWNERKANSWLWVELLLVFVALWVIIDWGYVNISTYLQPKGFNIDNVYQIEVGVLNPQSNNYTPPEEKTTTTGEDLLDMMERLRRNPEIEYVSYSINSYPYNYNNRDVMVSQDSVSAKFLLRSCTPDFFNVFRYENVDGSGSSSLAEAFAEGTLVVPSNFWEDRYPDGKDLLGQNFYLWKDTVNAYRVVALTKPVKYSDFHKAYSFCMTYISERSIANINSSSLWCEICIRTYPGVSSDFKEKILRNSPRMYNVGNCYINKVESFSEKRNAYQLTRVNEIKKRAFILSFLLVNIFLGIVGTFWYRTQQRSAELGLRIALGSSRKRLYTLLVGEAMMILSYVLLPAMIICYNIGKANIMKIWLMEWGVSRFLVGVLITLALMALMIIIGIWYPAYQAMKVQPAEVLNEE